MISVSIIDFVWVLWCENSFGEFWLAHYESGHPSDNSRWSNTAECNDKTGQATCNNPANKTRVIAISLSILILLAPMFIYTLERSSL